MAESILSYQRMRKDPRTGQPIHWGRADRDAYPFRGPVPNYNEAEYEQRVGISRQICLGFFDLSKKEQNDAYLDVLSKVAVGWFKLRVERLFYKDDPPTHYLEWMECYMEDGTLAKYEGSEPPQPSEGGSG